MTMHLQPGTLAAAFARLSSQSSGAISRGRDCAKYTLPYLAPQDGTKKAADVSSVAGGFSRYGARLVKSLAGKMLLAVLPPRHPFFRFSLALDVQVEADAADVSQRTEISKTLGLIESRVQDEIESGNKRTVILEALRNLIVVGAGLLYLDDDGDMRFFPLGSYVVARDGMQNVTQIVTAERIAVEALPATIRDAVRNLLKLQVQDPGAAFTEPQSEVTLFTGVTRGDTEWTAVQEVEGLEVPGSQVTYPLDACPWMPQDWNLISGENYGRSHVEDHLGDLKTLEGLTAAFTRGTAAASKLLFLRNPNGLLTAKKAATAVTGDILDGKADDLTPVTASRAADFSTLRAQMGDLRGELGMAFCMNTGIQRSGERVTAEEIRYMAQELDAALGGIYTALAQSLQAPLLRRVMGVLERQGAIPKLPPETVRPVVTTGLDAIGRSAELDTLKGFVEDVVQLGGPQALQTYINPGELIARLALAYGIRSQGLVVPPEVVAQRQQAAQMQSLAATLGPNAITQAGQIVKAREQMFGAANPTTPTTT